MLTIFNYQINLALFLLCNHMKKIYIVEDTDDIREILDEFLSAEGFAVSTFETIKDFSARDRGVIPDLYLFDIMLPDGSGKDLCNEIKNSSHSSVPVILMSANARIDKMKNYCNPDDFLVKPFDLYNLVDRINNLIHDNHAMS